ncbi:MAG: class F sortase [Candidatus Kaiserbacteria bacterium]|nr:MAG: class F sortase [Candidatus Kaiserbacteria bacterium]
MQQSRTTTVVIGIITIAAIVTFGATLARALWYSPDTEVDIPSTGQAITPASPEAYPARLEIPSLDIDAAVQYVGINAKGNMANPSNFTDVGWYKGGTVPGSVGSAVMAGHLDNALALDGVFKRLKELKAGDSMYVTTVGGEKLRFVVQEASVYNYLQAPVERIFKRADRARLNLITCEGEWIKSDKTYDERRVVYAVLAS